jgi:amino acid transporter
MGAIADLLLGKPLSSDAACEEGERVGPAAGVPILGLDALASAAYGPEALLTVLLPLGLGALGYVVAVTLAIVVLLGLVNLSYRQTIRAYPQGGGSYTVAKENLSREASLVAAAALLLDYLLNVAVAISAGIGALASAVPSLLPQTLPLCLAVLALLTVMNLRGFRATGTAFALPTVSFGLCMALIIGVGVARIAGGHPSPVVPPPVPPPAALAAPTLWMLARSFGNGCTAMTGVEAVSNGVPIFRAPATVGARRTLTIIIASLVAMLLGIAFLCRGYGVVATRPAERGYQSILSQLAHATLGGGALYACTMASILVVLALSANTSFADFPRVCRMIAQDGFLPEAYALRGRRLVFSHGILVLAFLSAILLIAFQGTTDRLIPLYAVGALLAFTLSQIGMVVHWHRHPEPGARVSLVLNAAGALGTSVALVIVLASKFLEGAWISALIVVGGVVLFMRVRGHYDVVTRQLTADDPLTVARQPLLTVVPLKRWSCLAQKCLNVAMSMSPDVVAVHLPCEVAANDWVDRWSELVAAPARDAGVAVPRLVCLESPFRELVPPLVRFVRETARQNPDRPIAVVVPRLVERRWWYYLLHNGTPTLLRTLLALRGGPNVIVVDVPWYLAEAQ